MVNTRSERLRTALLSSACRSGATATSAQVERPETGIDLIDAAAVVGVDLHKSRIRLWMEKTGRQDMLQPIAVPDAGRIGADLGESGSDPAYWTRILEQILAAHYMHRTGRSVRQVQALLRHPKYTFMHVSRRREIISAARPLLLECVSVPADAAQAWEEGVPADVRIRIVHLLAVTGAWAVDVLVLIGGQELRFHRMERNEAEIAWLIEQEAEFWRNVELDQAPAAQDPGNEEAVQIELWLSEAFRPTSHGSAQERQV